MAYAYVTKDFLDNEATETPKLADTFVTNIFIFNNTEMREAKLVESSA